MIPDFLAKIGLYSAQPTTSSTNEIIVPVFTTTATTQPTLACNNAKVNDLVAAFGINLQRVFAKEGKSVFFSPVSIMTIICMLAETMTEAEKQKVATKLGVSIEELRTELGKLTVKIDSKEHNLQLSMVNAVGVPTGKVLNQNFAQIVEQQYHGIQFPLHGDKAAICAQVNKFVSDATHQMIPELLSEAHLPDNYDDLMAILLNAIHFKAKWLQPFDAAETTRRNFNFANGKNCITEMMQVEGYFNYHKAKDGSLQLIDLPYRSPEGRNLTFCICLPGKGHKLDDVMNTMQKSFAVVRSNSTMQDVELTMPKLSLETKYEKLADALMSDLGILSNPCWLPMLGTNVKLGKCVHQAKIIVDEEGTEAAAATAAICAQESFCDSNSLKMIVDHDFAYFLMDGEAVLFQGTVTSDEPFKKNG